MTREEQLKFCQVCLNQKISLSQGIICRLTNRIAEFEGTCSSFEVDEDLKNSLGRTGTGIESRSASQGIRLINYMLDSICIAIVYILLISFIRILLVYLSPVSLTILDDEMKLTGALLYLLLQFIYYSFFESISGRTPAKYLTRTKVVDEDGKKPEIRTILLRTVCRYIPFEPLSYLGSGLSGWHDEFSKTRVIRASAISS